MKTLANLGLALSLLLVVSLNSTTAQQYSGYPGDDPVWISQQPNITLSPASLALILPPSLDNSALPFYPKEDYTNTRYKFDQKTSNSCVVSAMTFYTFTFEINRLRNADGQYPENKYSVNSLYNHMNDGTNSSTSTIEGTQLMMKENGVMNSSDWGNLDINDSVRWPSGYDLYENALDNRISGVSKIMMSQQGNNLAAIEVVKHYLYDHGNGESTGGLLNLPVFYWCHPDHVLPSQSAYATEKIKIDISSCGEFGHMVTIVGYDNNVKYDWGGAFTQNGDPMPDGIFSNSIDNNGDGQINLLDWEIGGFKIADNYGSQGNNGFYWILYRNLHNATLWAINPIEQYQPVLYLKVKANHWQRDLLARHWYFCFG